MIFFKDVCESSSYKHCMHKINTIKKKDNNIYLKIMKEIDIQDSIYENEKNNLLQKSIKLIKEAKNLTLTTVSKDPWRSIDPISFMYDIYKHETVTLLEVCNNGDIIVASDYGKIKLYYYFGSRKNDFVSITP